MTINTTRRAILAGAAALPALSIPAIASAADGPIFALERELVAALDRAKEGFNISHEAAARFDALKPAEPETPQPPAEYAGLYKKITHGEFEMLPEAHPLVVWNRETRETRDTISGNYRRECDRLSRECGLDEAEENASDLSHAAFEIGERIFASRARTTEGLMVKFRTVSRLGLEDDLSGAWASIRQDIEEMSNASRPSESLDQRRVHPAPLVLSRRGLAW